MIRLYCYFSLATRPSSLSYRSTILNRIYLSLYSLGSLSRALLQSSDFAAFTGTWALAADPPESASPPTYPPTDTTSPHLPYPTTYTPADTTSPACVCVSKSSKAGHALADTTATTAVYAQGNPIRSDTTVAVASVAVAMAPVTWRLLQHFFAHVDATIFLISRYSYNRDDGRRR